MKLSKRQLLVVSFMLFSLFFGAGNLIFPPFLGQSAGSSAPAAMAGFLATAVVLPILGVMVVAKFGSLDQLAKPVSPRFGLFFSVVIYLSIGPCLAIPRAASVPFEMAVAPYLPESANLKLWMTAYSLVFFLIALRLCLNPGKLVDRIGQYLTPSLLLLLGILFVGFLFRGQTAVAQPQENYARSPFLTGFTEGYNTMDALAGLNFGLVVINALYGCGLTERKQVMGYTLKAGVLAGTLLALVYGSLTYMGMNSSGVYALQDNGAWTLRCIVQQVFGEPGAILLAAIFTLACLTVCIGLINSTSQYFSMIFPKISYRLWAYGITVFAFLVCNLGLTAILSISIPILNAIYPMAIMLILLGLTHKLWENNSLTYPLTIAGTGVISVLHALDTAGLSLPFLTSACRWLPLYDLGFGWISVAVVMLIISVAGQKIKLTVDN